MTAGQAAAGQAPREWKTGQDGASRTNKHGERKRKKGADTAPRGGEKSKTKRIKISWGGGEGGGEVVADCNPDDRLRDIMRRAVERAWH